MMKFTSTYVQISIDYSCFTACLTFYYFTTKGRLNSYKFFKSGLCIFFFLSTGNCTQLWIFMKKALRSQFLWNGKLIMSRSQFKGPKSFFCVTMSRSLSLNDSAIKYNVIFMARNTRRQDPCSISMNINMIYLEVWNQCCFRFLHYEWVQWLFIQFWNGFSPLFYMISLEFQPTL